MSFKNHAMTNFLPRRKEDYAKLLRLERKGYHFKTIKRDKQFRIDGVLDVYTSMRRYHDLKTGERGSYDDLEMFIPEFFDPRAKRARRVQAWKAIERRQSPCWNFLMNVMCLLIGALIAGWIVIPMIKNAQEAYVQSRIQEIQAECDSYPDVRFCPYLNENNE